MKEYTRIYPTKTTRYILLYIGIGVIAFSFLLSSGLFSDFLASSFKKIESGILYIASYHLNIFNTYPAARRTFIFQETGYTELFNRGLVPIAFFNLILNGMLNILFQPLMLCIFTPQVILNFILFPFFLYGVFVHFRRIPQ